MIPVVAKLGLECEPVVGPVETLAEADVDTEHLEILVGVVGILDGVVVIVVVAISVAVIQSRVI